MSVTVLVGLLFMVLPGANSLAAPMDLTRPPDGILQPCRGTTTTSCVARAVGDFNGDGSDDIVFQRVQPSGSRTSATVRTAFLLVLGPLGPSAKGHLPSPVTTIYGSMPTSRTPLTVSDVNSDELDDLVFLGSSRDTRYERLRVAVLLGRRQWLPNYSLGGTAVGDVVVTWTRRPVGAFGQPKGDLSQPSVAFEDVNADGHTDIVLGVDTIDPATGLETRGQSQAAIMFGNSTGWSSQVEFRPDVTINGIGGCGQSLVGAADVSADGMPDIIFRRCSNNGLPDLLAVVEGRSHWPPTVTVEPLLKLAPRIDRPEPTPRRTGGGGYVPQVPARRAGPLDAGPLVAVQDLNSDGVPDLAMEFGDKTHVWLGGPGVASRVAENVTDRVFIGSAFGAVGMTRTWRPIDLDGDGKPDMILHSSQPLANVRRHGDDIVEVPTQGVSSIHLFSGGRPDVAVLDVSAHADGVWQDGHVLWGIGDFNGDAVGDLLLGPRPGSGVLSEYAVVLGPLVPQSAAP